MQYRSVFATCKNMNIFVTNMYTDEYKSTYGMPIRYGIYIEQQLLSIKKVNTGIVDKKAFFKLNR